VAACEIGSLATAETRRETASIDLGNIQSATVELRLGAGELRVAPGTRKLMEANFSYNVPEWKPVLDYRDGAEGGELKLSQPNQLHAFGNGVNDWDVKLNGDVLLDITANLGAGEATLDLGRMNLSHVEVNIGAGKVSMDLRGEPVKSYGVQIQGGVGETTVYLPRNAAISARATKGIGEIRADGLEQRNGVWINPDAVDAPVTVRVDVKGGIGEIHLVR
jgi:hypothetical protein